MKVVIANRKGGSAKTTTAMYLTAAALMRGQEATVYDADPQASATLWSDIADEANDPLPFQVIPANARSLRRINDDGWCFIDTPSDGPALEAALFMADMVVVPSSDSAIDLQQAWLTLDSIRQPSAVLLTRAERRTRSYGNAINAISDTGTPCFSESVQKRQEIKNSFGHNPRKLYEYAEVFTELMNMREV